MIWQTQQKMKIQGLFSHAIFSGICIPLTKLRLCTIEMGNAFEVNLFQKTCNICKNELQPLHRDLLTITTLMTLINVKDIIESYQVFHNP